ncbi:MAG: phosphatase PAP2 family protein [Deltaproteobacteria bacterium]|nr:phosphatase PAP2 family protein [Deltaproteobacteria bacterium]
MRRPALAVLTVLGVCLGTTPAFAEAWYEGPHGRNRVFHLSLSAGLGLGFVASESLFKPALAADSCRWCQPPGIDVSVRDAVLWNDVEDARLFSHLTGYVAAPLFGLGMSALSGLSSPDAGWARLIDDTIPIFETIAISQAVTQMVKWSFARRRPFVHFENPPPDQDDNLSFWSGHSALAFGVTTSAGLLARWRGSNTEPLIWGVGLTLATATGYLRIAGDKHYFTDVVTGATVGVIAGLTIPRLMRRHSNIAIVPAGRGIALTGAF